jgi:hypothetical protein
MTKTYRVNVFDGPAAESHHVYLDGAKALAKAASGI